MLPLLWHVEVDSSPRVRGIPPAFAETVGNSRHVVRGCAQPIQGRVLWRGSASAQDDRSRDHAEQGSHRAMTMARRGRVSVRELVHGFPFLCGADAPHIVRGEIDGFVTR